MKNAMLSLRFWASMALVLTLGFPDANGAVVLFAPDQRVPDGGRLF